MLRPIVVGLDGSPESLAAADWAAGEALLRGLPLRLIHAWEGLPPDAADLPELEVPRHWARRILRSAMDPLAEKYPQVRLSGDQIARPAADALVTASAESELLVLGSRAFSGFGGFMAGSVASATVAHAVRPVVLVRAGRKTEDEHQPDAEGGPSVVTPYRAVVVGLDPAHSCEELLAFAFETAALHAAPLRVLYTLQLPYMPLAAEAKARRTLRETATRRLDQVLGPWREKYPALELEALAEEGRPAQRLLDITQDAGLLVVGRRIRTAVLGTHTGPVAHAVVHHARCPVAVVPHE
ncbi:universal stress protein [Streptomyces sp. NPDC057253]|uniref:universal stress protein n=1 Tax=Streptomyces sp. NPDC057253 TaxID=3346069 RepID=UPI00363F0F9C